MKTGIMPPQQASVATTFCCAIARGFRALHQLALRAWIVFEATVEVEEPLQGTLLRESFSLPAWGASGSAWPSIPCGGKQAESPSRGLRENARSQLHEESNVLSQWIPPPAVAIICSNTRTNNEGRRRRAPPDWRNSCPKTQF